MYKKDLEAYPGNGSSMYGLIQALEAQKKTEEAIEVTKKFDIVWRNADVKPTSSRLSSQ